MCNNFPNIRITEGNNFSLILPLRSRTYVATRPIDEDIDPAQLENVIVTFGGVEYPAQITAQGVQIDLPATLAVGTYNILLTAEYLESSIRAAYESAVTIVPWSAQSTAEQYITGSPIVMRAAYVLSGAMTDAELEALKQEYREKNAELDQAIAEYERRAAELDGVAQEATLTQGVQDIRADIAGIDTSGLAKQGSDPNATNTAILQAIQQSGGGGDARESTSQEILALLAAKTIPFTLGECEFVNTAEVQDCAGAMLNIANCTKLVSDKLDIAPQVRTGWDNIKEVICRGATKIKAADNTNFRQSSTCEIYEAENATEGTGTYAFFSNCSNLKRVNLLNFYYIPSMYYPQFFSNCLNIIDLVIGKNLHRPNTNIILYGGAFVTFNPSNAMLPNSQSLLTDEDIAAGFTSNLEKFLYNLREHFAANLADLTGQASKTIYFSAAVKSVIQADQSTADAFTNKNWTIA